MGDVRLMLALGAALALHLLLLALPNPVVSANLSRIELGVMSLELLPAIQPHKAHSDPEIVPPLHAKQARMISVPPAPLPHHAMAVMVPSKARVSLLKPHVGAHQQITPMVVAHSDATEHAAPTPPPQPSQVRSLSADARGIILAHVRYPRRARRLGWQGQAEFQLDVAGHAIRKLVLLASSGHALLDQAARQGIVSAEWLPLRNGRYHLPVRFRLQ